MGCFSFFRRERIESSEIETVKREISAIKVQMEHCVSQITPPPDVLVAFSCVASGMSAFLPTQTFGGHSTKLSRDIEMRAVHRLQRLKNKLKIQNERLAELRQNVDAESVAVDPALANLDPVVL